MLARFLLALGRAAGIFTHGPAHLFPAESEHFVLSLFQANLSKIDLVI